MDDEEKLWRSQMRNIGKIVTEYACLSMIEQRTEGQQKKWMKLQDEIICDWELYPSIFVAIVDRYKKDIHIHSHEKKQRTYKKKEEKT